MTRLSHRASFWKSSVSTLTLVAALMFASFSAADAQISERHPTERTPDPARTENFHSKRFGVFFHYLDDLQNKAGAVNSLGRETSWNDCVKEFDVERFADRVAETGAGYAFFTMMQQTRFFPAPNETFDRLTGYKPGEACATRDLVMEIADALAKRNIDLYLYWTGDGPVRDPQAFAGLKGVHPVTAEYMKNWSDVAAEYGQRYGKKVKGWWVDGSYSWIGHNEETRGILAEGLRAGNPDRILAFNPGVDPVVQAYSDHDDFTAGEQNSFTSLPETGRFLKGAQWHILTYLGGGWGGAGTKLSKEELAHYVWTVNRLGGVVTIDLLLYRDGELDRSQLETLKPLRSLLAGRDALLETQGASGNLVAGGTAFLRSADGIRSLIPSVGSQHAAMRGIDGDPNTTAVGGGEYPWSLVAYPVKQVTAKKVSVLFGDGFPTDFEVFIKPTGQEWKSLGRFANPDGQKRYDLSFEPEEIEAVKVTGWKPDAEGQPGAQMSVAELEVY